MRRSLLPAREPSFISELFVAAAGYASGGGRRRSCHRWDFAAGTRPPVLLLCYSTEAKPPSYVRLTRFGCWDCVIRALVFLGRAFDSLPSVIGGGVPRDDGG